MVSMISLLYNINSFARTGTSSGIREFRVVRALVTCVCRRLVVVGSRNEICQIGVTFVSGSVSDSYVRTAVLRAALWVPGSHPQRTTDFGHRLARRGFMVEPTLHQRSRAPSAQLNNSSAGDTCRKVEQQVWSSFCSSFFVWHEVGSAIVCRRHRSCRRRTRKQPTLHTRKQVACSPNQQCSNTGNEPDQCSMAHRTHAPK